MKEIYGKISYFSAISGTILLVAAAILWFVFKEGLQGYGDIMISLILAGAASLGSGWFFKEASAKLPVDGKENVQKERLDLEELIFQPLPSLYQRTALISNEGWKLYEIAPADHQPVRKWLTASMLFSSGFFFPVTYEIRNSDGRRVAAFTYKNEWKRMLILLWDGNNELIGHLEIPILKSLFGYKAYLYDAEGMLWRVLEAKNTAGDIDVADEEGRQTASYRFGIFPYTLHPAFQAQASYDYVRLGSHISNEEKQAYVAIFSFWLRR